MLHVLLFIKIFLFCYKGKKQAEATGKRLAQLNLPYTLIVKSTMTRALETSEIIEKSLSNVSVEDDSLLIEGAPIPPEPPIGNWRSEKHVSKSFSVIVLMVNTS